MILSENSFTASSLSHIDQRAVLSILLNQSSHMKTHNMVRKQTFYKNLCHWEDICISLWDSIITKTVWNLHYDRITISHILVTTDNFFFPMPLFYIELFATVSIFHSVRAWSIVLTHQHIHTAQDAFLSLLAMFLYPCVSIDWARFHSGGVQEWRSTIWIITWRCGLNFLLLSRNKLETSKLLVVFFFLLTNSPLLDLKVVLNIDENGCSCNYRKARLFLSCFGKLI